MTHNRRRGTSWIYLVYLLFLAFQPAFDTTSTRLDWLLIAPMVALFVPVYLWTFRHLARRPFLFDRARGGLGAGAGIVAMAALGLVCTPFNSGAGAFFIYAAAAAGRLRPRRVALWSLATIFVLVGFAAVTSPVPFPYVFAAFAPAFVFVPISGLSNMYEREREQASARLAMAQEEIERLAAVAERERIARDLHDVLGHTLSTITLKAELAARLAEREPARAVAEMRDVERVSREALAQVRETVRGYRAHGVQGELANARLALEAAGVAFDYYLEPLELSPDRETVLALALREAVTNVVRHARARHCVARLEADAAGATLTVVDDGVGGADREGNGLSSMAARLRTVGGSLRLESGNGTRLEVRVPRRVAAASSLPSQVPPGTEGAPA